MLGLTHIVDVRAENPNDYRFEVYGAKSTNSNQANFTDLRVGDVPYPQFQSFVKASYLQLKQCHKPVFSRIQTRQLDYRRAYRRLLLPLSDDGRNVTHALVACAVDDIDVLL